MMNYIIFSLLLLLNITVYFTIAIKTCPEPYQIYENGDKCFSFLASRAQWITAEQACQQNDGKLATIDDAFDETFISSEAYSFYATYSDNDVWIGLNNLVDGGDKYLWTDGSIPKYTDWGRGQPLTQGPNCVSQTFKNGSNKMQYWSSQSCCDFKFFVCEWNEKLTNLDCNGNCNNSTTTTTTLKPTVPTKKKITDDQSEAPTNYQSQFPTTVCNSDTTTPEVPSSPQCDFNFTFNYEDGRCYKVMDLFSIIDHDYEGGCRQFNGHLPSIHNLETNAYIVDLVANAPPNLKNPKRFGIIIGLQRSVTGAWEWTDGTPKDFLHWYKAPYAGGCSAIIVDENDPNNHKWYSIRCTQDVYAYVCYNLPKKNQLINF